MLAVNSGGSHRRAYLGFEGHHVLLLACAIIRSSTRHAALMTRCKKGLTLRPGSNVIEILRVQIVENLHLSGLGR